MEPAIHSQRRVKCFISLKGTFSGGSPHYILFKLAEVLSSLTNYSDNCETLDIKLLGK